jgi:hypothetical protein
MLATRFMQLFDGHRGAYGTYDIFDKQQGIKLDGKAVTRRAAVVEAIWQDHLEGKTGIGIVPIRDDNSCKFGAIDIDEYKGFDLKQIVDDCQKVKAPVVVCRSKSGGAHIYLFIDDAMPAVDMRRKLQELAEAVGYADAEIFPKQDVVLSERGDVGNWINMPYFEGSKTTRYGVKEDGSPMQPEEFCDFAEGIRVTRAEFIKLKFTLKRAARAMYKDAPPCIEHLMKNGFETGARNNGLFNVGVFARKLKPEGWQPLVMQIHKESFDPPLSGQEFENVMRSLDGKDYQYTCAKPPIRQHCNPGLCRTRKYGVGGGGPSTPRLSSLQKYNTDPPIWFLDMDNGSRLSLATEDLQNQSGFQKRCMEVLNYMPAKMSQQAWNQMIQALLQDVVVIEAPQDSSPQGQFEELVERFMTGKAQAKHLDEILLGKPFHDQKKRLHLFRLADLLSYFDKQKFKDFKLNQISSGLRDMGGTTHVYRLNGKRATVWEIPEFDFQDKGHETPDFAENSLI